MVAQHQHFKAKRLKRQPKTMEGIESTLLSVAPNKDMNKNPEISIVVPVYNEEPLVGNFVYV